MSEFSYSFTIAPKPVMPVARPEIAQSVLPNKPSLEKIQKFQSALEALPGDLKRDYTDLTSHYFADGLYARALFIPAGDTVVGKMHRQSHINFLMKGTIRVWTEQGMKTLEAPQIITSEPGCKRVGYALTDTVWVTVHASTKTDLKELEAELIIPERPFIEHEQPLLEAL